MTAFLTIREIAVAGKAGHIAANTEDQLGKILVRRADANINSGLGVVDGVTPGQTVKAPSNALEAKRLRGVLLDPEFKHDINAAADYLTGDQVSLLEEGYIWVNAEATVAVGDDVYVRHTSDGGSNTTPGTFRPDNDTPATGIVITPTTSGLVAAQGGYTVRLRDKAGHDETFTFVSTGSITSTTIATGLVALIDASPNFAATGTTAATITTQAGTGQVEVLQLSEHLTITTPARAERVEFAEFVSAVTGAGLAKIRLRLSPNQKRVA